MMRKASQIFALLLLLLANLFLLNQVKLETSDIDRFFPQVNQTQNTFSLMDYRFIFIESEPEKLELLQEKQHISHFLSLHNQPQTHLVFFKAENQAELLSHFASHQVMGTPIVGELLSNEFVKQTHFYLILLGILIIPFIIWLSSLQFFAILSQELLSFSALILGCIWLFEIELNPAYLLSLLFIYLYAFTTINQLHLNEISDKKLAFSIGISFITTFLSGLLLSFSDFGIISDFGESLIYWLIILSLFIAIRLAIQNRTPLAISWFKPQAIHLNKPPLRVVLIILGLVSLLPLFNGVDTQFNSLLQSTHQANIKTFEKQNSPAQPVLLALSAKNCNFTEFHCNQKLFTIEQQVEANFPLAIKPIFNLDLMFTEFSEKSFNESDSASFAQFKLVMELTGGDELLYSSDYSTSYQMVAVSLLSPIDELAATKNTIDDLNKQNPEFNIQLLGRFNDVAFYKEIFFQEMWLGISVILFVLLGGIYLLYGSFKANITLIPALLTLGLFTAIHWALNLPFTIMSLVAIILFVGLIADNVIHILMAYKTHYEECFKVAFKPILLTNIILVMSLSLVLFVETGFLKIFGLELALLLGLHLILIVLLLPSLFKWTLPKPQYN